MSKLGRLQKVVPKLNILSRYIRYGEEEAAKKLLIELRLEVTDEYGRTALIKAVINRQFSMINWLIEKDANLNHQDKNGYSCLHFIAQNKEVETPFYRYKR